MLDAVLRSRTKQALADSEVVQRRYCLTLKTTNACIGRPRRQPMPGSRKTSNNVRFERPLGILAFAFKH